MKRILLVSILSVSAIALTFNSCKKTEPDTETQSAVDNSVCEGEFTSRMPVVHGFAIKENGVKQMLDSRAGTCPSIYINPLDTLNGFPVTMVLDYGTTGCVDSIDGKIRKGQISATFSKSWDTAGAMVTVKLLNYYVKNSATANFVQYACDSIVIIRNSLASFTNNVIGGKCIAASWNLEWACSRTFTQTTVYVFPSLFFPFELPVKENTSSYGFVIVDTPAV